MSDAADPLAVPAGREDVLALCRLMLGREPEADQVEALLAKRPTIAELRLDLLRNLDFQKQARRYMAWLPLAPDPLPVESDASPDAMVAMLARVGAYWDRVGQKKPHWSVITQARFLPENIGRHKQDFDNSGRDEARMVTRMLDRHGVAREGLAHAVDFGCAVGRTTLALAPLFARVTGCDISAPHMALARQDAAERRLTNLAWHRTTVEAPMPEGGWDLWFSRITLQHNPPPVMAHLLRIAFAGLRPGGVAIFQLPVHRTGYAFSVASYLAETAEPAMEMHVLPQAVVLALSRDAGLDLLEIREDRVLGNPAEWLSNLFVFRRPG